MQEKLDKNVYGHERHFNKLLHQDHPEYQYQIQGYKRRKLRELSIDEKIGIVDDVMVKKDSHDNVCSRYGIGRESIKTILKSMKKDPFYLRKQHNKDLTEIRD